MNKKINGSTMKSPQELAGPLQREGTLLAITDEYRRKLINQTLQMHKHNRFWSEIIAPNILVPELDQHVALHRKPDDSFSHKHSEAAQYARIAGTLDQGMYPLFSNTMRTPMFGPGYPTYTNRWSKSWEKPISRGAIGQFWTFTYEWDCEDEGALQQQFDWVWLKDLNGLTEFQKLHFYFKSQFKDYRGNCAVWSGGKSVHLNFIFDPSHMSKETIVALADRQRKSPEAKLRDYWRGDINPDMIWGYYTATWNRLNRAIHEHSAINVPFDTTMATLFQKRRTPWGIRIAKAGDARGFDVGDEIPQVVLDETILQTSSKSASGKLLCADDANAMPLQKTRSGKSSNFAIGNIAPALLQKLNDYLVQEWGAEYPKPAEFFQDDNGIGVRFFNSLYDVKPSSMAYLDYCSMVYRGKDAPTDQVFKFFLGKQTLNDLLCDLQSDIEFGGGEPKTTIQTSRLQMPWTNVFTRAASSRTIGGIRSGISQGTWILSQSSTLAIIVSVEGAGKSTSLIRQAGRFRLEDQIENFFQGRGLISPPHGHQIVACKSYIQAEVQYRSYNRWRDRVIADPIPIRPPVPLLIMSFAETYSRYCVKMNIDPIGYIDALGMGFDSQVEAVMKRQPSVFAEVTKIKDDAWQYIDDNRGVKNGFNDVTNVLVFTTHDLAQGYNRVSKSKAWLNPSFTSNAFIDQDTWIALATEFTAYRVIHDELSLADLVYIAHEDEVRLANQFKTAVLGACDDTWANIKISERLRGFNDCSCKEMRKIGFHRINEVADLNFCTDDVVRVDYNAIPFGVANKPDALYRRAHGQIVYVRSRNWWATLKARVVFTTTELLPANVANAIFANSSPKRGRVVRWDGDAFFPCDPVKLKIDERTNKSNVQTLANEILYGPKQLTDMVITDMATGPKIISHSSARGSNDLNDKNLASTLTSIGEDEYKELNVIAQKYGIQDVIIASYRDRYNQAIGRNRGLRGNTLNPLQHDVYITPRLLRVLGGIATFSRGRYPAYLVP